MHFYEDQSDIIAGEGREGKGTHIELTDWHENQQHNIILVHGSAVNHIQKNTEPTLAGNISNI